MLEGKVYYRGSLKYYIYIYCKPLQNLLSLSIVVLYHCEQEIYKVEQGEENHSIQLPLHSGKVRGQIWTFLKLKLEVR